MTQPATIRCDPQLERAIERLRTAAAHLVCMRGHDYGGHIRHDIDLILDELMRLQQSVGGEAR